MRTLPTAISTELALAQMGFCEIVDIYLKSSILTPYGTTSTIRITSAAQNLSFYTPSEWPEPTATQGDAATYTAWPMKRRVVRAQSKSANDKLALAVSNVTGEWATMLDLVDWRDCLVIIRKISLTDTSPAATDYATVFIGSIDSARVTLDQIQFTISSNLASLSAILPGENMHAACRFRFGDDMCALVKLADANTKPKICAAGGSTTQIITSKTPHAGTAATHDHTTGLFTAAGHGLQVNERVRFAGGTPAEIVRGKWYYVRDEDTDNFEISETPGGPLFVTTDDGSGFTFDSAGGCTEDSGSSGGYGTDLVNALANGDITASSEQTGYEGYRVRSTYGTGWKFSPTPSNPTFTVEAYAPYVDIDFGSATSITQWIITNAPADDETISAVRKFEIWASTDATTWTFISSATGQVSTGAQIPSSKIIHAGTSKRYWRIVITRADRQPLLSAVVGKVQAYATSYATTDLVNPLADGSITGSSEKSGNEAKYIKTGNSVVWKLNQTNTYADLNLVDWGNNYQGYWQIPDGQAGLVNAALEPYLQFDLGSAVAPKLWRFTHLASIEREEMVRLVVIFSSTNASDWTHEGYFELPPRAGETFDCRLPDASAARYWRICVRTMWAEQFSTTMFAQVEAYADSQQYWAHGRVTFDAATITPALQGISRAVLTSYNHELNVEPLPAAPQDGDTFTLERGCPRSFNACCERGNWENYGGFDTLPNETVIR